jgi:DNA-binding NtrC family response regulator
VRSTARPAQTLKGLSVLVVEDDFFVATELAALLRDAGAAVVHSCRTIGEATAILNNCDPAVAILDVRIGCENIAPVAHKLSQRGTPFLFYTGQVGGDRLMAEWAERPILSKPSSWQQIVGALAGLLQQEQMLPRRSA